MAFALDQTLSNVALIFADEAQAKGMDLRSVSTSVMVDCEPVALMRIVMNLVANAINHSAGRRVLIGVRRGAGTVSVQVVDNGVGMTAEQVERTFAPYVSRAGSKGEGLGLAVVKALAEDHGMAISVRSRPGAGTVFAVEGIRRAPETGGPDLRG